MRPSRATNWSGATPSAGATWRNSICFTFHAAVRAGGVIEAVVRLPFDGGPAGNSVSPIRTVMSSGRRPNSSATTCARIVPMPVPRSCTLDSTSTEPSRSRRTSQAALLCTLAPHSDCATPRPRLTGPASAPGAWRRSQPMRCAPRRRSSRRTGLGSMRSRSASGSRPSWSASSSIACSMANAPGVLPGPRIAEPRPGVDEHVVLRGGEIRAGVQPLGEVADAGADADPRGAIFEQGDRGQRAVAARANAQVLPGGRTVAAVELFLLAIEHQPHRRAAPGATA